MCSVVPLNKQQRTNLCQLILTLAPALSCTEQTPPLPGMPEQGVMLSRQLLFSF